MLDAAVALVPVLVFLAVLFSMDSFKLVPPRTVFLLILSGALLAHVCAQFHGWLLARALLTPTELSRIVAPVTEELVKALPVVFLLARKRVGFLVDAAILGFAAGAGFALVENVEYLLAQQQNAVIVSIVRGFGTAVLHGGMTAILALIAKSFQDLRSFSPGLAILPGLVPAIAIHALYNSFPLPPMLAAVVVFAALPAIFVAVFSHSEKTARAWLGAGFDSEVDLLQVILNPEEGDSPVRRYLLSLRSRFDGSVVADMFCLLRVELELSIRAKGMLMARKSGVRVVSGVDVRANLAELQYLRRSIGRTGLLALEPMLPRSNRRQWQIHMLESAGTPGRRSRSA